MTSSADSETYVAFLRGINVGKHHKVPMAELKSTLSSMGFKKVTTLLNSGNVIFQYRASDTDKLETEIETKLDATFGFPVPTMVREAHSIHALIETDPFSGVEVTKDIRLYTSLLKKDVTEHPPLPWSSDDASYRILGKNGHTIFSVLDLSVNKTPKAMDALEQIFGKDITTRNWNTIQRVAGKLQGLRLK